LTKQVGDVDHLKLFANVDVAETWFEENNPEGAAYEVLERDGANGRFDQRGPGFLPPPRKNANANGLARLYETDHYAAHCLSGAARI
jgi:hypothetical protein